MPTSDPLYRLVDLWREGKLRQVILMDQRSARTSPGNEPLEWPWSILVEDQRDADDYDREHLSRYAMGGRTPDHAAERALKWATDPKFRRAVIRRWERNRAKAARKQGLDDKELGPDDRS